jgi:hypothetical protein
MIYIEEFKNDNITEGKKYEFQEDQTHTNTLQSQ